MKKDEYIGKWGVVVHTITLPDNLSYQDYPFKGYWHYCIGFTNNGLLKVKFSSIELLVSPSGFTLVEEPDFKPFDNVKYVSTKKKLEFGVVVGFGVLIKPYKRKVYQLSVNGKVKSTLYEKERLTLIKDTSDVKRKQESLSKLISHALRHEPDKYGLELDTEGWVEMENLIQTLRQKDSGWQSLRYYDVLRMIDASEKKRHEVKTQRIGPEYKNTYRWFIRAKYGHSIEGNIYQEKIEPPEILYHGTTDTALEDILIDGLKPMGRQYVHLSGEIGEAIRVGKRRQESPRILKVNASQAFKNNVNFYRGNDKIWLSDEIAPEYIELLED